MGGDIVILGPGAPPEFRQCSAIVTKTAEAHCTVVVLDGSQQSGVGECWPSFADTLPHSSALRLGARVMISGLKGAKTQRLNGFTGCVVAHPRSGHPTFIHKR